ncbi:hypothetical protein EIN_052720 [Entamoeba invadens IP1]|uniref:hypothetical protein n=1 Tax=Entamoeba invadens IP1 TaxID=370355 RepID=UPI0002C3F141|nr:hypothetical protein EIN_052720 [Entamoeba invadens IP1]ELP93057.1 hypothetical protein EIN_052720 [Entamoeba invadens IP1]|eukprot:XP_004259828.1 hypothetical protein EIN_052720 [Entamoeba invadens IP1]
MDPFNFSLNLFTTLSKGPVQGNIEQYKQAEQSYNALKTQINNIVGVHLVLLQKCTDVAIKRFCLTCFRTTLFTPKETPLIDKLNLEVKVSLCQSILVLFNQESASNVLNGYSALIGMVFENMKKKNNYFWKELFASIPMWIFNDSLRRHCAFKILTENVLYTFTPEELKAAFSDFVKIIDASIQHKEAAWVIDSLSFFQSFFEVLEEENSFETEKNMIAPYFSSFVDMCKNLILSPNVNEEEKIELLLDIESLVEMGFEQLTPHIPTIFEYVIITCANQNNSDNLKENAWEIIDSITARYEECVKHNIGMLSAILEVLFQWVKTVEVTQEWAKREDESDVLPMYARACVYISNLYENLGVKRVLDLVLLNSQKLIMSRDWKERHVLLVFFHEAMNMKANDLSNVYIQMYQLIQALYNDESPRNRQLALRIISKIVSKLKLKKMKMMLDSILQIEISLLKDPVPRIASSACDFLCTIFDTLPTSEKYNLGEMFMPLLYPLLSSADMDVVSEAVCAISYLVARLKEGFIVYYPTVKNTLEIILNATGVKPDLFTVKGRAIECLSVIGRTLKGIYCEECATLIVQDIDKLLKTPGITIDNAVFGFIETSFSRIAEVLGGRVSQFMPTIMEIVWARMQMDVVCKDPNADEDTITEVKVDKKVVSIHTELSNEKKNAMRAARDYSGDMKEYFYPWALKTLDIMVKNLSDPYDEDVRSIASEGIVGCLRSLRVGRIIQLHDEVQGIEETSVVVKKCMYVMCERMSHERYVQTQTSMMGTFILVLEMYPLNKYDGETMEMLYNMMTHILDMATDRLVDDYQTIQMKKKKLDNEEIVKRMQETCEDESEHRIQIRKVTQYITERNPALGLVCFSKIMFPKIQEWLTKKNTVPPMFTFLYGVMATVAVTTKNVELANMVMAGAMTQLQIKGSGDVFLLQVSRLLIEFNMKQFITQILGLIKPYFTLQKQSLTKQAAVLVYGRCITSTPELFSEKDVDNWLSVMPLINFYSEGTYTLLEMVEKKILSVENVVNMKKVLDIVSYAEYHSSETLRNDVLEKLKAFINFCKTKYPDVFNLAFAGLDYDYRTSLVELVK